MRRRAHLRTADRPLRAQEAVHRDTRRVPRGDGSDGVPFLAAVVLRLPLLTGFGFGGENSAINSAVDELIPAKKRGRVDIAIKFL